MPMISLGENRAPAESIARPPRPLFGAVGIRYSPGKKTPCLPAMKPGMALILLGVIDILYNIKSP